jgi:hypothetical protein
VADAHLVGPLAYCGRRMFGFWRIHFHFINAVRSCIKKGNSSKLLNSDR